MKAECELCYVALARVELSEIYFEEGEYKLCADLLAPFCDMWLISDTRPIGLWKIMKKCTMKEEFVQAWEDIVDEDIRIGIDNVSSSSSINKLTVKSRI